MGHSFALSLIAALTCATSAASADDLVRPHFFPVGEETCFGRIYDSAHLAGHPEQKVTRFMLWNELTQDQLREYEDETSAEKREYDKNPENRLQLVALIHLRDQHGLLMQTFDCGTSEDSELFCGIDCDGGYFTGKTDGRSLIVTNEGFMLEGVCDGGSGWLGPEPDDETFRLDPLPAAACLEERDSGRPSLAEGGPPLRTRFEQTEPVCYERAYDETHLVDHEDQAVAAIWLRNAGEEFTIGARLRDGKTARSAARCGANTHTWSCFNPDYADFEYSSRTDSNSEPSPVAVLSRAGNDLITLRNHRNNLARLLGLQLGAGDDIFELRKGDPARCGG